jgi:hypothetical protein
VKRRVVTAAVVVSAACLFAWEWAEAPRVAADARAKSQLPAARGQLYLGDAFEGLALRTVRPFLYSDCEPGLSHPVPCRSVVVRFGRVSGTVPAQVERARRKLRRVG